MYHHLLPWNWQPPSVLQGGGAAAELWQPQQHTPALDSLVYQVVDVLLMGPARDAICCPLRFGIIPSKKNLCMVGWFHPFLWWLYPLICGRMPRTFPALHRPSYRRSCIEVVDGVVRELLQKREKKQFFYFWLIFITSTFQTCPCTNHCSSILNIGSLIGFNNIYLLHWPMEYVVVNLTKYFFNSYKE